MQVGKESKSSGSCLYILFINTHAHSYRYYLGVPGGTYLTVGTFHERPSKHGSHPPAAADQQWFVGTDGSIIQLECHICPRIEEAQP